VATARVVTETATAQERLFRWRSDELRRAGYDEREATLLAMHLEVDLHYAVELVRRGCPPTTALKILL